MPGTAAAFVVGSAAIVGLPPLNGFVSEWLVFRSLLLSGTTAGPASIAVLAAAALALIGALALACFAKVFGVLFLGTPRDSASAVIHESAGEVRPMLALAGACFAIGLAPVLVVRPVLRVGSLLAGVPLTTVGALDAAALPVTVFAGSVVLGCALLFMLLATGRHRAAYAHAVTWGCGYPATTARMQYTASSFAAPILLPLRGIAGLHVTRTADSFATHATDPVMDRVVLRVWRTIRAAANRLRLIQRGRLSLYLLYIVATLVALLTWLLFEGRSP
jgi:NADH:ubiquinone oxidoreductase subunit 5 (subunit L)/multisubunit Na+/H+ antiporter MnhA subunit